MPSFEKTFPADFSHLNDALHGDEEQLVNQLLALTQHSSDTQRNTKQCAKQLIQHIRREAKSRLGIENLMHEYALTEQEGILLMCLAEALLRIPDKYTCDALIADKLVSGHWDNYVGKSDMWLINASAWGLLVSGKVLSLDRSTLNNSKHSINCVIRRCGEPLIRSAIKAAIEVMGRQFVLGENLAEALNKSSQWSKQGYLYSYDMLGEGARTMADADYYFRLYKQAIDLIGTAKTAEQNRPETASGISIKLSAIHPRFYQSQQQRVIDELLPRLTTLAELAASYNINLTIDAEESYRLEICLSLFELLLQNPKLSQWRGLGTVIQAYQRRAPNAINWLVERARHYERTIMIRLVKGAYWDSEIKRAQQQGLNSFPVFTRKQSTDVSYTACAGRLLAARDCIYPQFATHNALTVATILSLTDDHSGFEFQRLHGMGEALYQGLKKQGHSGQIRIYAPVGEHESLLSYLVRRLLENGANSSFVNQVIDPSIGIDSLLELPNEYLQQQASKAHPMIAAPAELFSDRANSTGLDFEYHSSHDFFNGGIALADAEMPRLAQLCQSRDNQYPVINPATNQSLTDNIHLLSRAEIGQALDRVVAGQVAWQQQDLAARTVIVQRLAVLLQNNKALLMGLCAREAGKSARDTDAEVREAIDFCHYYARQAHALDKDLAPLGTVLCISPWNFPLALFIGQLVAALVTGNTVIAKPAEQTALVATKAIELFIEAGLPKNAVELIICDGKTAGAALLRRPEIAGLLFTGSTTTAQHIYQQLAQRDGPMPTVIAETGGQNAMVVDSSALAEQVVDDIISAGFHSAGQRCSALRVLYVQEDIADKLIDMIKGAMQQLCIGQPDDCQIDVGPIIDQIALQRLQSHQDYLDGFAKRHYRSQIPQHCKDGLYFPPSLYEIDNIEQLKAEVFGPIVHVIRFASGALAQVITAINSTGFGLTMAIHSRIQSHVDFLVSASCAGNIYVNRHQVGAVVGVQPFGGSGLSGTGPKAGGPLYLKRLLHYTDIRAQDVDYQSGARANFSQLLKQAKTWQQSNTDERLALIRHGLGEHSVQQCEIYSADIGTGRVLESITGEDNRWQIQARGLVWFDPSIAVDNIVLSRLVGLSIMSGNGVVMTTTMSERLYNAKYLMNAGVLALHDVANKASHQQLVAGDFCQIIVCPAEGVIKVWAADKQGALAVLLTQSDAEAAWLRLIEEKSLSNNISAACGNAKLMADID